jgi:hypothetical protein
MLTLQYSSHIVSVTNQNFSLSNWLYVNDYLSLWFWTVFLHVHVSGTPFYRNHVCTIFRFYIVHVWEFSCMYGTSWLGFRSKVLVSVLNHVGTCYSLERFVTSQRYSVHANLTYTVCFLSFPPTPLLLHLIYSKLWFPVWFLVRMLLIPWSDSYHYIWHHVWLKLWLLFQWLSSSKILLFTAV